MFGGRCGDSCHNELYALNTNSKVWRKIPCTDGPIGKYGCGFISYSYQNSNYLLVLGGKAKMQPEHQQQDSLCITCGNNDCFTNEIHIMDMTKSPGMCIIHVNMPLNYN